MRVRIYVPIKCPVCFGPIGVPDSFTSHIVGFILGETCAQGRSTRLFRETLMYLGG